MILLLATMALVTVQADNYLTFQTTTDETTSIAIGSGLELTISGTTLTAGSKSFDLTELSKMFFTEQISVGTIGWATYSSTNKLDYSNVDGLTAYTASFNDNANTISLTKLTEAAPSGEGVVITAESGDYYVPIATAADELSDNDLIGTGATALTVSSDDCYALAQVGTTGVGFCKVQSGVTIPANKAYYQASNSSNARFMIVGDATAISQVETAEAADSPVYDLQGRRVSTLTKGIYITTNGKKVVIK